MQRNASIGLWRTFLVSYCGVATSLMGPSAQGLDGAVVVIMKGARVRNSPTRMGMAIKMYLSVGMVQEGRRQQDGGDG